MMTILPMPKATAHRRMVPMFCFGLVSKTRKLSPSKQPVEAVSIAYVQFKRSFLLFSLPAKCTEGNCEVCLSKQLPHCILYSTSASATNLLKIEIYSKHYIGVMARSLFCRSDVGH